MPAFLGACLAATASTSARAFPLTPPDRQAAVGLPAAAPPPPAASSAQSPAAGIPTVSPVPAAGAPASGSNAEPPAAAPAIAPAAPLDRDSAAVLAAVLAKARALFQQALALETAGDWAGASNLFQQVATVRLTPQVRFHLALCEEHLGKIATAFGLYQIAAEDARQGKAPEVLEQVAIRVDELKARIPKLVIRRGAGADSASILLDGVSLGAASIGADLPIDPGPHTIEARARGSRPFTRTLDVGERDRKQVEVTLEALPPIEPVAGRSPLAYPKPNYLPYVLGGMGAASLITSSVFFILRSNAVANLDDACPVRSSCSPDLKSTYDHGKTYTLVADVTLAAGLAALGTATVLYLIGRDPDERAKSAVRIEPAFSSGAGMSVRGSF